MGVHAPSTNVPVRKVELAESGGTGSIEIKKAHGLACSLMFVTRGPGYRGRPRIHDCEQINYVVEGEIWYFTENKGFRCQTGDYLRIPRNKVHWAWNRTDKPVAVLEAHSPPLASETKESVSLLEDAEKSHRIIVQDKAQLGQLDASVFIIDGYDSAELEKKHQTNGISTGLYRSVRHNPATPNASGTQVKSSAYGNECDVTVGDWKGYHSKPHFHDCEQINYIIDGDIWFFVEDRGYHCHAGDFLRIPSGGTHWAWHRSDKPVKIGQVYTPPFLQPPLERGRAGLFDFGEAPRLARVAVHVDIVDANHEQEKVERASGLL